MLSVIWATQKYLYWQWQRDINPLPAPKKHLLFLSNIICISIPVADLTPQLHYFEYSSERVKSDQNLVTYEVRSVKMALKSGFSKMS